MAQRTTNLSFSKFSYCRQAAPDSHDGTNTSTAYRLTDDTSYIYGYNYLLFGGLGSFPSNLKRNKIIQARLRAYVQGGESSVVVNGRRDFDAGSVTYNTIPSQVSDVSAMYTAAQLGISQGSWADVWLTLEDGGEGAAALLNCRTLSLKGPIASATGGAIWYAKTVLANGSTRPYIEITYDDAATVKSKPSLLTRPAGGDVRTAKTATWKLVKASSSEFCYDETWTQASAKFFWRVQGGSWSSISVSGSTMSVTIPANTFPPGATIEYYVQTTDTDGTTAQTSTFTLTTDHSAVTPSSYPTGTINPAAARTFSWTLPGAAQASPAYTQASAKLFWKASTESSYHQLAVSGSTMSLTVPANTFPSNATIQWYLQATDTLGYTSTSTVQSFTTMATTLALSSYPTGSGIDTRNAITFAWTLSNAGGSVPQRSAVLYWRVQGASTYNQITNSSANKSIITPANTFPTGSSIEWYVAVTDATGVTLTGTARSFSTASSRITPQTYPSGNSVDFGSGLTFSWLFKPTSGSGSYGQRSASLFWRASTEDEWTEIPASGSTQRVTVPAFTFPSNSTISWYLTGTDIGGTTSSSNTQSFKTVAPKITPQNSPTSGYADPRNAITFSWFFSTGSNNYPQQSADFYWRVQGQTAWNHVAASGSTQSVTIPANTFPLLSIIEWYLTGTDIGGTYSETEIYAFSTTASTAYAVCMEPVGKAVDGSKPTTLKWIVQNEDGSEATRTIVRWKLPTESQSQWHELIDTTDSITTLLVPADTFPAGPIEWLVIAYNRDGVAGPANQASFVCIVAPDPPSGLTATAVPLTTISWQSTGQEAYEISIDGTVIAEGFGSDVYSYRVKEPLADGAHTISVRIQGSYGLWSEASETQIFVENIPKGSLTLTGEFGADAELFWEYAGEDDPETVSIYRDAKWIGTATGLTSARDRYVLGRHEYRVEYWFEDGYYTRSNTVAGTMDCSTMMIAELSGGPWLSLRLSENPSRTQNFQRRRVSAVSHITATKFPVLETSAFEDLTGSYDCAFRDRAEAEAFERLFGKVVILKSRGDMVIMGGLTETKKKVTTFYAAYTFSIQQIHVEDFVHHDEND